MRKRFMKNLGSIFRHLLLALIGIIWLIPIIWLLSTSLGAERGINTLHFFPTKWTFANYDLILFHPDTVAQFPIWFWNTLKIAIFSCIISSMFVLMVSYVMSRMRFRSRKLFMNIGILLGLFPGFLAMIAVYFILKSLSLTNNHIGLIMIYSGSAGLGYLVAKGFFDTIPKHLDEAAKIEGASEAAIFWKIIIPLSKPIIVYTVISSFLAPWMDFVFARIILNSGDSSMFTVSVGLWNMLTKTLINSYFSRFCAGGVLVSIPISILFIIMQKFYVEGVTRGSVKG